jgi:hypothetical protein
MALSHFPPSSADLRAMRESMAAHPLWEDERDTLAAIMAAPVSDPLAGDYGSARLWGIGARDRDQLIMPAPDDMPSGAEPVSCGATPLASADAGAWWSWLTRQLAAARVSLTTAPSLHHFSAIRPDGTWTTHPWNGGAWSDELLFGIGTPRPEPRPAHFLTVPEARAAEAECSHAVDSDCPHYS